MNSEDALRGLLSAERLAPYEAAAQRLGCEPLHLYDWNVQISSAFFEGLHYFEVGLRNALDTALQNRYGSHDTEWFDVPGLLTQRSRQAVHDARRRAHGVSTGRRLSHGKTVAELPLGFWWSLTADEYNRTLWQPALQHAFAGSVRRRTLHRNVDDLRRLRNRIAHHEPIHGRDLPADHALLIDSAARIHGSLGVHIAGMSRVPEVLQLRPTGALKH